MRGMRKLWAATVALVTVANTGPADACAPAPHEGAFVGVTTEDAIVAFDPTHGREDFIRRATFQTEEKDFGFLVPTPTKPELAAAPDGVFDTLARIVAPKIVRITRVDGVEPTSFCAFFLARSASEEATAPVQVLETKRVAGYDAAVLAADDAGALAAWLKDHGYATRDALARWLEPYVAKRWIVTAFKVASDANEEGGLATEAVRMSFTTDKPFFPYREPADQRENLPASAPTSRALRIFVLMPDRAAGALGDGNLWPGTVKYAQPANPAELGALPFALAPNAWLTAFEDLASPRPGTDDLFFTAATDRASVTPPPIERVHGEPIRIPIELPALAIGIAAWFVWRRRRARRA
jgi:hypothetical protein